MVIALLFLLFGRVLTAGAKFRYAIVTVAAAAMVPFFWYWNLYGFMVVSTAHAGSSSHTHVAHPPRASSASASVRSAAV